tara:strand:- start:2368 stop:3306 length:939 start_codon:yes stop_codon:yes gene_type:complete
MSKRIVILGGAGYIGTSLCNYLVKKNYNVTCFDSFWFGDKLDKRVKKIRGDIRKNSFKFFKDKDVIINLAYLANDPLCEIDARGTWEIGPLAVYSSLEASVKYKVKKYIFASSGSIYGLKKEKKVTENLGLDPITDYNKSKMICEQVLKSFSDKIDTVSLRPATVCGSSPRLRLDVVLNLFCYQAYFEKKIKILGGNQIRPILHIDDMIRVYEFFIKKKICGVFNVGFENIKIKDLANSVKKIFPCEIQIKKSNDPRSYRMNSDKLISIGFKPYYNHLDAIYDLKQQFENKFKPGIINWNLAWLEKKKIITK